MADQLVINESHWTRGGAYSTETTGDRIVVTFDVRELGKDVARAIRDAIAEQIKAIKAVASPATLKQRQVARKALARGAAWAVKRYGNQPPGETDRMFNDSGELADHIGVEYQPADSSWSTTAPPDRLTSPTLIARLRELVPALRDPLGVPAVRAALQASLTKLVRKR